MPAVLPVLTPSLVREIERVKAQYMAERAEAAAHLKPIRVGRFGGVTAIDYGLGDQAGGWRAYQRIYGLGIDDLERLDEVLAWLAQSEAPPCFYVLPLEEDEPVLKALAQKGLAQVRTMSVLFGDAAPGHAAPGPEIEVRWAHGPELDAFAKTYLDAYGWDVEDRRAFEEQILAQYSGPRWRICLAEINGIPVAAGILYLGDSVAYLTNAATIEDYRKRGCHRALLALRIERAAMEGCEVVAADTTPYSPSQRNMERVRMRLAYQQLCWQRPES